MGKRDKAVPAFWVFLGLAISIWSATFPFGELKDPGPAFLPLACGILLTLLGLMMVFQVRTQKADFPMKSFKPLFPQGSARNRVAFALGSMVLSTVLLNPLGFTPTVFLLILFLMRSIQPTQWRVALLYAFIYAVGSLIIFKILLQSQLPGGVLGI